MSKQKKCFSFLFILVLFLLFSCIYTRTYPAVLFNTDDWEFISFSRSILPEWHGHNPCRILPECLMPACSWLAATFIMPFNHDLVNSITIMTGIVIALFLTAYFYFSVKMLIKRFNLSATVSLFLSLLFILLHYLVFRKNQEVRFPLFHAISLTHVYFYLIPNIVNATLVIMYLCDYCNPLKQKSYTKNTVLIITIYFSLFSNLYASIMLPVIIGSLLFIDLISGKYKSFTLLEFFKANLFESIILFVWVIIQIFEINGGRSKYLSSGTVLTFDVALSYTIRYASYIYHNINHLFLFGGGASIIVAGIILVTNHNENNTSLFSLMISLAIAFIVSSVYIILVCSKASSHLEYTAVVFAPIFFWILLILISLAIIVKQFDCIKIFLPFICLLLAFEVNSNSKNFATFCSVPYGDAKILDDYIINSVIEADKNGQDILLLDVPDFGGDNWPLSDYGGGFVSNALYKYNIISRKIYLEFVPNYELNEVFHFS